MKIVVLDGGILNPGDLTWDQFDGLGDVEVHYHSTREESFDRVVDADIILTNKTIVDEELLRHGKKIKYVGVLATGHNVVDKAACNEKGIVVTNVPSYGTEIVAQFTVGLLLEICHRIGEHSDCVKDGGWQRNGGFSFWNSKQVELYGKTMGIIGYGRIGRKTAEIAKAIGMNVLGYRGENKEKKYPEEVSLDELLNKSDVICLHCNLTDENTGIINKSTIEKMKDGVIIINTSRGGLIVENDLADALDSGKVQGAGVDVVSKEPIEEDNPLLKAKNIFITPHMAWGTVEARQRIMDTAVENIESFIKGEPINTVTKD